MLREGWGSRRCCSSVVLYVLAILIMAAGVPCHPPQDAIKSSPQSHHSHNVRNATRLPITRLLTVATAHGNQRRKRRWAPRESIEMATNGLLVPPLLLLVTALILGGAWAQNRSLAPSMAPGSSIPETPPLSPGPSAAPDCMSILADKLSACLTYVEAGSDLKKPEKGCCGGFASVVKGEPLCLCSLLFASDVYGIKINRTRAFMLPRVCKVKTPPVSLCSVLAPSPMASASSAAPVGSAAAGVGGKAPAPSPSGNGVDPGFRSSALVLIAGLAFVAVGVF